MRGGGVDCAQLLKAAHVAAGVVVDFDIGDYPPDWMLHRDDERFLQVLAQHCERIDGPPLPGDIAIWRYFRTFSHAGIVTAWPLVVHAHLPDRCVVETSADERPLWGRPVQFWRALGLT